MVFDGVFRCCKSASAVEITQPSDVASPPVATTPSRRSPPQQTSSQARQNATDLFGGASQSSGANERSSSRQSSASVSAQSRKRLMQGNTLGAEVRSSQPSEVPRSSGSVVSDGSAPEFMLDDDMPSVSDRVQLSGMKINIPVGGQPDADNPPKTKGVGRLFARREPQEVTLGAELSSKTIIPFDGKPVSTKQIMSVLKNGQDVDAVELLSRRTKRMPKFFTVDKFFRFGRKINSGELDSASVVNATSAFIMEQYDKKYGITIIGSDDLHFESGLSTSSRNRALERLERGETIGLDKGIFTSQKNPLLLKKVNDGYKVIWLGNLHDTTGGSIFGIDHEEDDDCSFLSADSSLAPFKDYISRDIFQLVSNITDISIEELKLSIITPAKTQRLADGLGCRVDGITILKDALLMEKHGPAELRNFTANFEDGQVFPAPLLRVGQLKQFREMNNQDSQAPYRFALDSTPVLEKTVGAHADVHTVPRELNNGEVKNRNIFIQAKAINMADQALLHFAQITQDHGDAAAIAEYHALIQRNVP